MNILFIYKGRYFVRDTNTIEYLSSIAKKFNHNTDLVYDQDIFGITDNVLYLPLLNKIFFSVKNILQQIIKKNPDFTVFLLNFNNYFWIKNICEMLKNTDSKFKVILLSPFDWNYYKDIKYDYLLIGEPENVFSEFLSGIKNENITTKKLVNLDNLPLPDKELFAKYINFSDSYMVYTNKGCIGNCSYCEETIYKKEFCEYYRRRKPDNVIKELKLAKEKYRVKEIIFKDSVFTSDTNWLKEFLQKYRKEINVPFKCFGRLENFNEEIAKLLKSSGCYNVEFGIQTWNEKLKKEVLNRAETNQQARKVFQICDDVKLRYDIDHMFGIPGESIDDHIFALKEYLKLKYLNRVKCHNLVYLPKLPIVDYAIKSGYISKKYIKILETGDEMADFFNTTRESTQIKYINESFRRFFKIIRLFSPEMINFIIKWKLYYIFKYIPKMLIILGQVLIAIKNSDLRFKVYFKSYPLKIRKAILVKY